MKHDEMLRFYKSPDGYTVLRFGDKCFVTIDLEGDISFLAVPDMDSRACADAVVKKWELKRIKTINMDVQSAIESVMWLQDANRRDAQRVVSRSRKIAHGLVDAMKPLFDMFTLAPSRPKEALLDPLDSEFIDA